MIGYFKVQQFVDNDVVLKIFRLMKQIQAERKTACG